MIENLQNEHNQAKGDKLCVNIRSWRAKNSPKHSSKYFKDRIWKIKQYLNYILMIINQNILAIQWTFLNLQKKYEFLCQVHFHIDCPITSTSTLTLHKTKIEQMNPNEQCLHFLHTDISQTVEKKFLSQKMFSFC